MLFKKYFQDSDSRPINLVKNQVMSFRKSKVKINCLDGDLWITWPNGFERTLIRGQSVSVFPKGKLCISAFSESQFEIQRPGIDDH